MAKSNLLKGSSPDIINTNINTLKNAGYSHARATRCAMCHANKKHAAHGKKVAKKVVNMGNEKGVRIKS
jgi:hypothetical protein